MMKNLVYEISTQKLTGEIYSRTKRTYNMYTNVRKSQKHSRI